MYNTAHTGQLYTGGKYVQATKAEVVLRYLRLLSKTVHGFDERRLVETMDFLSRNVLKKHQDMLFQSLLSYLSVYCPQIRMEDEERPLWLELVRDNTGSRQFSPAWKNQVDRIFSVFGVPDTSTLYENVYDLPLLYRLGLHDEVLERVEEEQVLFWKLKIIPLNYTENDYMSSVVSLALEDFFIEALLKGTYAVRAHQSGKEMSTWERFFDVDRILLHKTWDHEIDKCRHIQLLNSMNYCLMKSGHVGLSLRAFNKIDDIVQRLENHKTRAHLRGVFHFHRSAFMADPVERISELEMAMRYDHGFFDYDYKMATWLHNQGDVRAKNHYEMALETSPFAVEIANDYGFFLQEEVSDECQSFERLLLGTGLYSQEDFI